MLSTCDICQKADRRTETSWYGGRKSIPGSGEKRKSPNQQAFGVVELYTELQKNMLDESSGKMNQRR